MDEWNDKELYYFFTLEATILDNPSIETLGEHLSYYKGEEEYLACAGIKLGIEFTRFYKLLNLYKELKDDTTHN